MESIEPNTHSFIVKIWLVELRGEGERTTWRGQITHVPSGQRHYFTDLDEITTCVTPYLDQWGVKPTWLGRTRQWLRRWRGFT
jgi:hypothetical protein